MDKFISIRNRKRQLNGTRVIIGRFHHFWDRLTLPRPPRTIPPELSYEFTLGGRVTVRHWYWNEVRSPMYPTIYTKENIDSCLNKIKNEETGHYGKIDSWLHQAIKKYAIQGKEAVVMGSQSPWYESICLYYGARCTTIDYNRVISKDDRLKTLTVAEYESDPLVFDTAISISSFEHDGLGRYGDPMNPIGDLEAMRKMKKIIKPGGLLFLAVPLGKDLLVWNAHRIYGRIRLPMLLKGWEVMDSFGFSEGLLDVDVGRGWNLRDSNYPQYQPIFVLKNV